MSAPDVTQPNDVLRSYMSSAVQAARLSDTEAEIPLGGSARKWARFDPRAGSRLATVSLVQDEEVLRWVYDPPPASPRRRARRAGLGADDQEVILGFQFLEVPPNEVIARLETLDLSLTPARGLRRWVKGQPAAVPKTRPTGRVLLLAHGTFSRGDMYFEEFAATEEGKKFLAKCEKKYETVLTFDHPTLAMSPWLNGLDLAREMAGYSGQLRTDRRHLSQSWRSRGGVVALRGASHCRQRRVCGLSARGDEPGGPGEAQVSARSLGQPRARHRHHGQRGGDGGAHAGRRGRSHEDRRWRALVRRP